MLKTVTSERAMDRHLRGAIFPLVFSGLLLVVTLESWSQVVISGQASAGFANGESGASQYTLDEGRATFLWRGDLFVDAVLSDHFAFLSNIRILQDQELRIDRFALRASDIASTGINAELGQVDLPLGNLGERRFPWQNPFYRLPLMNEHLTTLCPSDYNVWILVPAFALSGEGVRILDLGLYDLGLKVFGVWGVLDYSLAVINGMPSATSTYGKGGLNGNDGLGTIARLAVTPMTGLTVGASYGTGSFMNDQSTDSLSFLFGRDPDDYPQNIVGGDLEFSLGYFSFYGQAVYNIWKNQQDLKSFGYSAEAQYALTPRCSFAARAGGLIFNEVTNLMVPSYSGMVPYSGKWDHDVFRLETSLQFRLSREALVKVVYEWNRTFNVIDDPADNLLVIQTVLSL
jgi:hypothetical protein